MQDINDNIEVLNKLEITIFDFYYNFDELIEENFNPNLYIISNKEGCLYVGISENNVWTRWFNTGTSHIFDYPIGKWNGRSSIGMLVAENQPRSLNWEVDLREYDSRLLKKIEEKLIVIYRPLYNSVYRPPLTESERIKKNKYRIDGFPEDIWDKMDRAFGDIFS